ncbi:MAG: hypothetical protein ACJ73D_04965 [Pyrinomonadaceae bacterium]
MRLEKELERVGHWECVAKVEGQKRWRLELEASLISASDDEATAIRSKIAELDGWIPQAEHANSVVYESIVKYVDSLNDLALQAEQSPSRAHVSRNSCSGNLPSKETGH